MGIIVKKRLSNGRRHIYLRIFSYKKKIHKGSRADAPKAVFLKAERQRASFLYRLITYPIAVYNEYQRLKFELKNK